MFKIARGNAIFIIKRHEVSPSVDIIKSVYINSKKAYNEQDEQMMLVLFAYFTNIGSCDQDVCGEGAPKRAATETEGGAPPGKLRGEPGGEIISN